MTSSDDNERVVPPDVVYNIFIRTTPQKVWDALTKSEFTTQYFFGRTVESDWKQGSPWKLLFPDGRVDVDGVVMESEAPKRLVVTWRVDWIDDPDPPGPALITYEIQQHGEIVQLTMTQHTDSAIPKKYVKAGQMGWGAILSSLKSLLETGQALDIRMEAPAMIKPVVKAEMLIRKPASDVFNAFADPTVTTKFWFTKSSGKLETGKRVRWDWEMYGVGDDVDVKTVERSKRIVFEWSFPNSNLVEMTFTPHAKGTIVTSTTSGFKGDDVVAQALDSTQGFNIVLCAAKAWLEHDIQLNAIADKAPDHNIAGW